VFNVNLVSTQFLILYYVLDALFAGNEHSIEVGSANVSTEAGVHVWHTETGDHMYTFKSAGPSPVVSWAPTKYCLAFSDNSVGALRIAGVDPDRK
jgi:hypothetical protein